MIARVTSTIAFAAFAVAIPLLAHAGQLTRVSGVVVDPISGRPVAGATVSLITSHGTIARTTDGRGHFVFLGAPDEGAVTMQIGSAGFLPSESRLEIAPGDDIHVSALLLPCRSALDGDWHIAPDPDTSRSDAFDRYVVR